MFNIVLKHVNGERKTVPVEYVTPNLSYLTIRWDLAGIYDLNLAVNVLTPRSAPGQAKGKAKWYKKDKPQWKAEDIAAVRKMASDYLHAKRGNPQAETEAAIKRHVESMPNPRIGEHPTALMVDNALAWRSRDRAAAFERYTKPLDSAVDAILKQDIVPFPHYEGDPDIEDEIG
jgi:hypothetical protein